MGNLDVVPGTGGGGGKEEEPERSGEENAPPLPTPGAKLDRYYQRTQTELPTASELPKGNACVNEHAHTGSRVLQGMWAKGGSVGTKLAVQTRGPEFDPLKHT